MSKAGKIVLHTYFVSSSAWRVRLALAYKGIDYEYKPWNLSKGEHMSEEYKKISPLQFVPALEIDGAVLNDSIAIIEYLEERFPEKPLLPKDLAQRSAVRSVANAIASGIQPLQNLRTLNVIKEKYGEQARADWAQYWIISGFKALEQILEKSAGKCSFGDQFTVADCFLIPQLANAARFNVDMAQFPVLQRLQKSLYELDLVANSTPEHQPDNPSRK